jgi:hypothetical protein
MMPIVFTARLQRRDYMWLAVRLALVHRVSLTVMLSGPVLWGVGWLAHSGSLMQFGATMSWLIVGVPLAGLLSGAYVSYRPAAAELFIPVEYAFSEMGIEVAQGDRRALAGWSEFVGWRRVGGFYLLHTSPARHLVVAARDVPAERLGDLEALLDEHLSRR